MEWTFTCTGILHAIHLESEINPLGTEQAGFLFLTEASQLWPFCPLHQERKPAGRISLLQVSPRPNSQVIQIVYKGCSNRFTSLELPDEERGIYSLSLSLYIYLSRGTNIVNKKLLPEGMTFLLKRTKFFLINILC